MAKESKPRPSAARPPKKAAHGAKKADAVKKAPRRPAKKPKQKTKRVHRSFYPEFRPDSPNVSPLKVLRFTHQQRLELLRWVLYIAVCVLCLVIQDSIMSRVSLFGSTTDLAVAAMLIITVLEGSEVGSVFILIASCIYYFSGSSPGPYSVGIMTVFGLLATVFRQTVWHRSSGSIIFCAGIAILAYEIGIYGTGIFLGLTRWYRLPRFVLTALYSVAAMIPLYHIIFRIGQIGGYTWKE